MLSERTKSILFYGLSILGTNVVLKEDWEPVILAAILFVSVMLAYPYVVTFMTNQKQDHLYK